ncbi:MAG: ATP-binding protein [Candidatus Sulfotelmatobacter sp.]
MTATSMAWTEQNQANLLGEFAMLRSRLGVAAGGETVAIQPSEPMELPSAIDEISNVFNLSTFERELLLLCAGVEMESALAQRCAELVGRQRGCVTFALAMAVLAEPHWSALAPSSPLRRYRLIEMEAGHGLTAAPLRIDERILHYLAGVNRIDQRLAGLLHPKPTPEWMADEHWHLAKEMIASLESEFAQAAALHLCGDNPSGQESIAALIAQRAGRQLFVLRMEDTPASGAEMEQFLALWTREMRLLPAFLLLQWESESPNAAARQLAEKLPGPLLIASREALHLHRVVEQYEVNKAAPTGQKKLWEIALGPSAEALGEVVDQVADQFRLSAETIVAVGTSVVARAQSDHERAAERLWNACRSVARPRLETLAERIVPVAGWDDLILPDLQKGMLQQLAAQARYRMMVYERWGFAARGRRGLGLSALFSGPSGTGKTLAAEVLAADLRLDMYRIDLSAVVSKYIGETEKKLRQVFDAAETGGVLLLFDEADAIFGKRAEVKDSHDRYANIEVGYLLQRMESFQGIAILTTNVKSSLDHAFQRRLRFTVDFPFPDAGQREAIWARAFPPQTPTKELEPARLARLNMCGGNIRNIALNAAFFAAQAGAPVRMTHILQATQLEAAKVERPICQVEIRGWV